MSGQIKRFGIFIGAAIASLMLIYCNKVNAHSFYDPWCCSGRDCEVATKVWMEGTTIWASNKFGTAYAMVGYTKYFESPDQFTHACIFPNPEPDGNAVPLRCLYIPSSN